MYTKEDLKRDVEELKKAKQQLLNKVDDYKKELEQFLLAVKVKKVQQHCQYLERTKAQKWALDYWQGVYHKLRARQVSYNLENKAQS